MGLWYTAQCTVRESSAAEDNETMNPDKDTILSVNFLTLTEPPRRRQTVPDKIFKYVQAPWLVIGSEKIRGGQQ